MKYKDIVYELNDTEFVPYNMGVISTEICDGTIPIKCFAKTIQDVETAVQLCADFNFEDNVVNIVSEEVAPLGFYKKYVHYFIINVPTDTDIAYYPRIAFGQSRHWINGKLAFIGHCEDGKYATVYTITLKKGYNVFCVEHTFEGIPIVRIDIANRRENDIKALTKNNYWYIPNDFVINLKSVYLFENEPFEFNLFPIDLINLDYDSTIKMVIKSDESKEILYQQYVNFKEQYSINLSYINIKDEDKYNQLIIKFHVINKTGVAFQKLVRIFRRSPSPKYVNEICEKATMLLEQDSVHELVKNEIYHHINKITHTSNDVLFGKYLKRIINLSNTNKWNEYIYSSGSHYIYYFSEEDEKYYYYYIVLPENYDPSKEYPLLLTMSHGHVDNIYDSDNSNNYSNYFSKKGDIICADIGGRGAILGCYMGDVFIAKEIEHIFRHFSINRKKVYAVAHCAGNHGLLNFAQNHPDLFAGIYIRKSNIYKPNIKNLYNIFCVYLISSYAKDDPVWEMRDTIDKSINNFHYIRINDVFNEDIDLRRVQYSSAAIDLLMSKELDEYPNEVYFRTERNRARKAYYLEIESIENGHEFASIECHLYDNEINIKVCHCSGIKVNIPPKIQRDKLSIMVNGKRFLLPRYDKHEIVFRKSPSKGLEIAEALSKRIIYYKGSGLLDVYFSPLNIINCDSNNAILTRLNSDK